MGWKEILRAEIDAAYRASAGLIDLVDPDGLAWTPSTGESWMTVGQLLYHLSDSCGSMWKGFADGEWSFGDGDSLPAVPSRERAQERLAADKAAAGEVLDELSEADLVGRQVTAPWEKVARPLGFQLSLMIDHLNSHKSQLFYYLKLQGKPVHTGHLWGT